MFEKLIKNPLKEVKSSKIQLGNIYHPDGVYSEQIFGPINDYKCQCGNLVGKLNEGKVCPKCGVKCTSSILRYKEFGYIKLKLPVLNTLLLDIFILKLFKKSSEFKEIYEKTIFEDKLFLLNKNTNKLEIIPEFNHNNIIDIPLSNVKYNEFVDSILNQMINDNLITINRANEIRENYLITHPVFGIYSLYLLFTSEYVQTLFHNYLDNNPKYKIFKDIIFLTFIPVIPPEIRPIIKLSNGNTIEHEISKIYRSIIRLNYETDLFNEVASLDDDIVQNIYQKDFLGFRLQKLVRTLYDKLIDSISGKEGKIRSFILGKVIDFSGRAVIVPSLKIKPYEVLIPYKMAKEVLIPHFLAYVQKNADRKLAIKFLHIYNKLISEDALTDEDLHKIDELFDKFIDDVNSKKIKLYAFINRQPSIWPYSMNVFDVVINKDKDAHVIGVHPLIVESFNADSILSGSAKTRLIAGKA